MKRIVKIEITAIVLALVALGVYFYPGYVEKQKAKEAAQIKTDTTAFVQKALDEFRNNKGAKATDIAQKIVDELNNAIKTSRNNKENTYTFEASCKSCHSVETDDALEMIILTTYNNKGKLVARTVIKPPSFVTYVDKK